MREQQLGDVIDDFCVKCRRLTNHAIVSLLNGNAAKVRCRTCYNDHDYRHEQAPPTKRELMKQKELYNAVLSGLGEGSVGEGSLGETSRDGASALSASGENPSAPVSEIAKAKRKATS